MKKRIVTLLLVFSIIAFPASVFASTTQYEIEKSEPNNTSEYADPISISEHTDHVQIIGTVNQSDTEDWYALYQKNFSITINDLSSEVPMASQNNVTIQLSIFNDNLELRGRCIVEPLHTGDWKYPILEDILLRKDKKLFLQVKYLSGNPTEPYIIKFDIKEKF